MQVFGLDFTSDPTPARSKAVRRKRLMLAVARLEGTTLTVEGFRPLNGDRPNLFAPFEEWLGSGGEWIAGLDFPFGLPARFLEDVGWPTSWDGYVAHVAALGKAGFEQALSDYARDRPSGQKELFRPADVLAQAVSPMKRHYVPVAKMFFQGATRLQGAPVAIAPMRSILGERRLVVEAYPALVARKWLGRRSYKNDDPAKVGDAHRQSRSDLVAALRGDPEAPAGPTIQDHYGLTVAMTDADADLCVADASGDHLDSVLCAVQAAWSHTQRHANHGMPAQVDLREGWIVDPALVMGSSSGS